MDELYGVDSAELYVPDDYYDDMDEHSNYDYDYHMLEHYYHEQIQIMEVEQDFVDSDKVSGKYYIGIFMFIESPTPNEELIHSLSVAIQPSSFFQFHYEVVSSYLNFWHSQYNWNEPEISRELDIMHLTIDENSVYRVCLKTTWIRIIQRCWKKRFAERKNFILSRGTLKQRRMLEIHPKYIDRANRPPTIHGMLSWMKK